MGRRPASLLATLALVAAATIVLFAARSLFGIVHLVSIVYLIPVVIAASRWGTAEALLAAAAGALSSDFFFYPPLYSFWIADSQYVADLAVFLITAIVIGNLATRLKDEADRLRQREKEIRDLYGFSRELAACFTASDLIAAIQTQLSNALGRPAILIETQEFEASSAGLRAMPEPVREAAGAMLSTGVVGTKFIAEPSLGSAWVVRVLVLGSAKYAVIADLGTVWGKAADAARTHFDAVIDEADATMVRLEVARAIADANSRCESQALRDALIGSVSHELRSPLASILGSASVLDQVEAVKKDDRARSLVEAVHDQASRLDGDIKNLLDAARMTARGVLPQLDWAEPADLVNTALAQKAERLAGHRLSVELPPGLPLIRVDSAFVEQALAQLLDNAAKYSPTGSEIKVRARATPGSLVLSVSDEGSGISADEARLMGRRAFRGARHLGVVPGSGLGLWLASTFVAANSGTLEAVSRRRRPGTRVSLRFPIPREGTSDVAPGALARGHS
jgi:K+-sensing histidine kinase KdpD